MLIVTKFQVGHTDQPANIMASPDFTPIWVMLGTNRNERLMAELRALAATIDPTPPHLIEQVIEAYASKSGKTPGHHTKHITTP